MKKQVTEPNKNVHSQRKPGTSTNPQFPTIQPAELNPVVALQSIVGNKAVQRLLNRAANAPATPNIQRVQEINEDMIINGQLSVRGVASADELISIGPAFAKEALFLGNVTAATFTENTAGAGAEGGATTSTTADSTTAPSSETAAPTSGSGDLSDFGLGSP